MRNLLTLLCLSFLFSFSFAYLPHFFNGRPRDGFIGKSRSSFSDDQKNLLSPKADMFKQKLDHFEIEDSRTWQQRYMLNDAHFKSGGPLFVQIGGEGPLAPLWATEGNWITYAKRFNALCVLVEHRYYGESHPVPNMEKKNMVYLSSEQALADVAAIIVDFKARYNTSKTLVFGGSYSGSLAAWFRLKYPHLADGAISDSAPLLAKANFYEYLEVVYRSLMTYKGTTACDDNIEKATLAIESLLTTSAGRDNLKKTFQLCDDIDVSNSKDVANLLNILSSNIIGVVQYDKDNRAFEGVTDANITIDTVCEMMTDEKLGDPILRYAKINNMFMKIHNASCVEFKYDKMISSMKETEWTPDTSRGVRQWTYQTCVEFGFYQTSDAKLQPFGHRLTLQFSIDQCMDIYGKEFNETFLESAVKRTNGNYGALGIKVSKVVFYNGSLDPWHALGITTATDLPDVHTFYVNGTAHCAMMYPARPADVPELTEARQKTGDIIEQWGF